MVANGSARCSPPPEWQLDEAVRDYGDEKRDGDAREPAQDREYESLPDIEAVADHSEQYERPELQQSSDR
jgi:hypothetical protein